MCALCKKKQTEEKSSVTGCVLEDLVPCGEHG